MNERSSVPKPDLSGTVIVVTYLGLFFFQRDQCRYTYASRQVVSGFCPSWKRRVVPNSFNCLSATHDDSRDLPPSVVRRAEAATHTWRRPLPTCQRCTWLRPDTEPTDLLSTIAKEGAGKNHPARGMSPELVSSWHVVFFCLCLGFLGDMKKNSGAERTLYYLIAQPKSGFYMTSR